MTTIMSVKCKMNDVDAFKQVYEASHETHAQVGIIASTMYQDLDDPDVITVHHQFTDLDAAKATAAQWSSDEVKAEIGKQGFAQMDTFELTLLEPVS